MERITRRAMIATLSAACSAPAADDGWISLFDGKTLQGWTAEESPASWKVADGALAADGPRSHLFYSGPVRDAAFRNFELKMDVMTRPLANSGVYFHTRRQASGWPEKGFEVQVNNSALGEGTYRERKKTGSLYGVHNVYKSFARDNEWFRLHVTVRGKQVQIRLDDLLLVDFVEADPPVLTDGRGPVLGSGTFALQCHDSGSKVLFRNILVRPLPDSASAEEQPPVVDDVYRELRRLSAANYPVVDYHVHVRPPWTLDDALALSRRNGIAYGVAVNCGLKFPVEDEAGIDRFLESMKGRPAFVAMQAEGREWVKMFRAEAVARFDYVFSDAMTFTHNDRRMRLWIPQEIGQIGDQESFMDVIVDRIAGVLEREPIDIYVNPTFVPEAMAPNYDKLWTDRRIAKVVEAAARNGVAIEINNRYRLPGPKIIRAAKAAGCKFSFGTNNSDRNVGRLEYPLQMVRECGLGWQDIFVPKSDGSKPVQKRGLPG